MLEIAENGIDDIENEWDRMEKVINEAANETIGVKQRRRNEEWFDKECGIAIQKKNEARNRLLARNTRNNRLIYEMLRKDAKKVLRKKKKSCNEKEYRTNL